MTAYQRLANQNESQRLRSEQPGTQSLIGRTVRGGAYGEPLPGLKLGATETLLASALPDQDGMIDLNIPLVLPFVDFRDLSVGYAYDIPAPVTQISRGLTPTGFLETEGPVRVVASELHTGKHSIEWAALVVGDKRTDIADRIVGLTCFEVSARPEKPVAVTVPRGEGVAAPEAGCWVRIASVPDPAGGVTKVSFEVVLPDAGASVPPGSGWPAAATPLRAGSLAVGGLIVLPLPADGSSVRRFLVLGLESLSGDSPDAAAVRLQQIAITP